MDHRSRFYLAVVVIPALLLSACGPGKVAASSLERDLQPAVIEGGMDQLIMDNADFAFELFRAISDQEDNLVFSPYSISLALAMTYAGARGETARQMAEVMHYSLPADQLHPGFNALDLELNARPDQVQGLSEDDIFQLSVVNSLWGQDGWLFLPEYLDLIALNYGAGMRLVDFQNAPESARRQINDWVSDQTEKRIRDILAPGSIDADTRLVLANAIYFHATWEYEFDPDSTSDGPFFLSNGDMVTAPMMDMDGTEYLAYASGSGWQAVALPYKGGLTEMILIIPDAGNYPAFESNLTADGYFEIQEALELQPVILKMPKFTFETSSSLKDTLVRMGMVDAFDPDNADFSGIDGARDLVVSDAIHKAFIAVNEEGTEAAAATVVIMTLTSMPMQEGIVLTIDRPFIYLIRDVPTGTILFLGRVLDPR